MSANPDTEPVDEPPENDGQEVLDAQLVDQRPASEINQLATYREEVGPFIFLVIPISRAGHLDWELRVYMEDVSGDSVFDSRSGLTEEAAEWMRVSESFRNELNANLRWIQNNRDLPPAVRNQKRSKRALEDISRMRESG